MTLNRSTRRRSALAGAGVAAAAVLVFAANAVAGTTPPAVKPADKAAIAHMTKVHLTPGANGMSTFSAEAPAR